MVQPRLNSTAALRGWRAPDGYHRISDELLDRAAVALDDVARDVKVARQGVTDLFRIAFLGERGKADQIGEEDADEAALRGFDRSRLGLWQAADAAVARTPEGTAAAREEPFPSAVPQSEQKRASGRLT